MDEAYWQRVEALFHACENLSRHERVELLDRCCAREAPLRADVEAVLEATLHADGFIENIVRLATERVHRDAE
jgi:hypothetical protein